MTQRQDDTPTRPTPFAVADVDAFRNDPRDGARFAALRQSLRDGGQGAALAEICELRAPFEANPAKAAEIWAEAGEARAVLNQVALAERDLRAACALDPASERATARLSEVFMTAGKYAEAGDILEGELDELTRRAEAQKGKPDRASVTRRAARHRQAAQVWDEHLGRVDRALFHWQQAWQLEPERTDALAAARRLYVSLGDDAMVAKLYRAELDVLGERAPAAPRAELWLALGKIELRRGDAEAAAAALEKALRLDALSPGDPRGARRGLRQRGAGPRRRGSRRRPAQGRRALRRARPARARARRRRRRARLPPPRRRRRSVRRRRRAPPSSRRCGRPGAGTSSSACSASGPRSPRTTASAAELLRRRIELLERERPGSRDADRGPHRAGRARAAARPGRDPAALSSSTRTSGGPSWRR